MDQLLYHSHRRFATKIRINIDEPLEPPYGEAIPYGITELEFTGDFNQPIRAGDIGGGYGTLSLYAYDKYKNAKFIPE
ncbi:hypothetical protein DICPUDRAFT_158616 [Dictyostelium purpureum]|uniref:Methyltransferase n=1 Tax=Dictyostelium purpureum TaxID=5786 RepID=F1A224_DICPU|nr:uncharacterized protein DICPUDRAFT_158616 [Dictyostelium purpureum]EGC29755.1 hypothetical protein DICPUDRAFT_158616 [Dictyostelium purpureum]|eukprot:XP_003293723.1 hypothetical protein DICPUDRAFT_158616 [Dictyostelium purpureum]